MTEFSTELKKICPQTAISIANVGTLLRAVFKNFILKKKKKKKERKKGKEREKSEKK